MRPNAVYNRDNVVSATESQRQYRQFFIDKNNAYLPLLSAGVFQDPLKRNHHRKNNNNIVGWTNAGRFRDPTFRTDQSTLRRRRRRAPEGGHKGDWRHQQQTNRPFPFPLPAGLNFLTRSVQAKRQLFSTSIAIFIATETRMAST
jgi:hypothetical protein